MGALNYIVANNNAKKVEILCMLAIWVLGSHYPIE